MRASLMTVAMALLGSALAGSLAACLFPSFDEFQSPAVDASVTSDVVQKSAACPSPNIVCDDFESGSFSRWDSVEDGSSDTTVLRSDLPGGAARAGALMYSSAKAGNSTYLSKLFTPAPGAAVAVRAYLYLTEPKSGYLDILSLRGPTSSKPRAVYRLEDDWKHKLVLSNAADDLSSGEQVKALGPGWVCVEINAKIGDSAKLFINGVLSSTAALPASGTEQFGELRVGIYNTTAEYALGVDDVALVQFSAAQALSDRPHIGCL